MERHHMSVFTPEYWKTKSRESKMRTLEQRASEIITVTYTKTGKTVISYNGCVIWEVVNGESDIAHGLLSFSLVDAEVARLRQNYINRNLEEHGIL